jgi:hypothetical protein
LSHARREEIILKKAIESSSPSTPSEPRKKKRDSCESLIALLCNRSDSSVNDDIELAEELR